MSERSDEKPEGKKIGKFWLVFGAGVVLMIVYQSGYSGGARSGAVQVEKSVAVPQQFLPVAPINAGTNSQLVISQEVLMELLRQQQQAAPIAKPAIAPLVDQSLPRVIETGPVGAPANSVYDRRSAATVSPSQLGVAPLAPLLPFPETGSPSPGSVRTTYKPPSDTSATRVVSPVRVTTPADCDCGKSH